jgi:hypothetical protein
MNSKRYGASLPDFVHLLLGENAMDSENIWFQQYGISAHTVNISMGLRRSNFPGRLIK